jgi:exodeoxyribonuclease VII large subunit
LQQSTARAIDQQRHRLHRLRDRLTAADPEAPLRRGYVRVEREGVPMNTAAELMPNDTVTLHFRDDARIAQILPYDKHDA